ncbi:MAG: hypothetical protein JSS53_02410, partial [Proteobacteria bacterium]|nr:hypothetical protein [Pseudomonadota bacterium]
MLHLTIQDISDLFSKFEGDNNVLWIRDITYKKQLYISENYQKLFGQTCESLYEYPESWSERVVNLELSSSDIKLVRKESGICVPYSVISDSGEAYSVQDKSFIVYDKSGVEQVAVIGIANCTRVNDFSN